MSDDFESWHLIGIDGCVHADEPWIDDQQAEGAACDCPEGNAALEAP